MRTDRAEVVATFDQLVEAGLVDQMVTRRDLAGLAARVDILLTDRAVCTGEVFNTLERKKEPS